MPPVGYGSLEKLRTDKYLKRLSQAAFTTAARIVCTLVMLWWVTMFAWPWDEHISTLLHRGSAQDTSSMLTMAALPLDLALFLRLTL